MWTTHRRIAYDINGITDVTAAVVCQAAMVGGNGSWALLYGTNAVSDTQIQLAVDEDQLRDTERSHGSESLAYLVFSDQANQPPILTPIGAKTATEGRLLTFDVSAQDPDGPAPLVLTHSALPDGAGFVDNGDGTGTFTWTPAGGDSAASPYALTVTATEDGGSGLSDQETISITVNAQPVNQAPVLAAIGNKTATEGQLLTFDVSAQDPDGPAPLVLTHSALPDGAGFVDNGDGTGTFTWTPAGGDSAASPYALTVTATEDGGSGLSDQETISITVNESNASGNIPMESGFVAGVDENWITVNLTGTYNSPVVLASPNYDEASPPLVVRIRNAGADSFDMRVVNVNNTAANIAGVDVYYFVVDAGVYTLAANGIQMEAVRFNSTVTDRQNSWVGQQRSYANSYTAPVVLGQVMTENDPGFSVFWSRGPTRADAPTPSTFFAGKHVGEDGDTTRANETIGYVVIEAGEYDFDGRTFIARMGPMLVEGIADSPPYSYDLSNLSNVTAAVVSQSGMQGGNGGWTVLYGNDPISDTALNLAVDEDQIRDTERSHTNPEQIAYIVIADNAASILPFSEDFDSEPIANWNVVDEAGDPSSWVVLNGSYQQQNQVRTGGENFVESYHIASFSYLTTGLNLQNYQVSFDMAPTAETGDDVGCMIRYQNSNNFYRLTMDSRFGYTRLEKRVAGQFTPLASNAIGYATNHTYHIVINVFQDKIFVQIDGEMTFAVQDSSHMFGTFAFYSAAPVRFDNLQITDANDAPIIGLSYPIDGAVLTSPPDFFVSAIAANEPSGSHIEFFIDNDTVDSLNDPPYTTPFQSVSQGYHPIEAILYDSQDNPVAADQNMNVGVAGDYYVASGDSLTSGAYDNYKIDNIDPENPIYSFQGYPGPLGRLLKEANGYPVIVVNEGLGGYTAGDLLDSGIDSILDRNPGLNKLTILIGTNDSGSTLPATKSIFTNNLQGIVDKVKARNSNISVTVGITPPAFGTGVTGTIFQNPLTASRNDTIRDYRDAIVNDIDEIEIGPDFFKCLLEERNLFSLFHDNVHLNGLGYDLMTRIWLNVLTGNMQYTDPCVPPRFILQDLEPSTTAPYIKQNLLEAGDTYYVDEQFTITSLPPGFGLENGVWIMTPNGDAAISDNSYISFTVDRLVDVYIAYDIDETDPSASLPDWLSSYEDTGERLQVSDPSAHFRLYRQEFSAGDVQLGGNLAQGANGADVNYIVIIVEKSL